MNGDIRSVDRLVIDHEVWLSAAGCIACIGATKSQLTYGSRTGRVRKIKRGMRTYFPAEEMLEYIIGQNERRKKRDSIPIS